MKRCELQFTNTGILLIDGANIRLINYNEIIYFVTDRPYVIIGTEQGERVHIHISMSQIAMSLPSNFCMCSQSSIINLSYVDAYEENQCTFRVHLKGGIVFKVSRRYHNIFKTQILLFKKQVMGRL